MSKRVIRTMREKIDNEGNFAEYDLGAEAVNVRMSTGKSVEETVTNLSSEQIAGYFIGADSEGNPALFQVTK